MEVEVEQQEEEEEELVKTKSDGEVEKGVANLEIFQPLSQPTLSPTFNP
jgi:hypothetical protein